MGGKPRKSARQSTLEKWLHKDWVVLRWDNVNERYTTPGILYAVFRPDFAVVGRAWYHETIKWCPIGKGMTFHVTELEDLLRLMKA